MSDRYLKATVYPGASPDLAIDAHGFDYRTSRHSNGTTLVVKGVTADDLRGFAAQLLEQASQLETLTEHLEGWAPGNLQHHLMSDHQYDGPAPYDGPLDEIHRRLHERT